MPVGSGPIPFASSLPTCPRGSELSDDALDVAGAGRASCYPAPEELVAVIRDSGQLAPTPQTSNLRRRHNLTPTSPDPIFFLT